MNDEPITTGQATTPEDLEHHWRDHAEQWQQSGISQAAYCKQHQLVYHQFIYWNAKFKKAAQSTETPTQIRSNGFVGLNVIPAANDGLAVTLPSGVRINGIDCHNIALLSDVISAL